MTTPQLVPSPTGGFMGVPNRLRAMPQPRVAPPVEAKPRPAKPAAPAPKAVAKAPAAPPPQAAKPARAKALNTREKVLLALLDIHATHPRKAVTRTELVLACWRRWPETFGIPGHPEYPDTNRVLCRVPLAVSAGYANTDGKGGWVPTPEGKQRREHLETDIPA